MAKIDKIYNSLLLGIKDSGYVYETENRPGEKMKQISSANFEHSLIEFPLLTTKEVNFKAVVTELLWFLRGDNNIKFLVDNGVNIWNKDAYNWYLKVSDKHLGEDEFNYSFEEFVQHIKNPPAFPAIAKSDYKFGNIGRGYGVQWRRWSDVQGCDVFPFDQIHALISNLREPNPITRRHIVTAWNPAELDETALPPCHWSFEIIVRPLSTQQKMIYSGGDMEYLEALWDSAFLKNDEEAKKLLDKEIGHLPDYGFTLKWHQRSVDTFLGLPFNIASYATLAHIIGSIVDMIPLSIIGDLSNVHIYPGHADAVDKQLSNKPTAFDAPRFNVSENYTATLNLFKAGEITFDNFIMSLTPDDIYVTDYQNFGKIKATMVAPKQ